MMDADKLKRFLVYLPKELDFKNVLAIRQNLFKGLYYAATAEGKYLKTIFPGISESEIDELQNYEFPIGETVERTFFFNDRNKRRYTHPRNKVCARPFKKGEPVYRCQDCGFDETCVLCVHCFNKYDHEDHDVYMYISKGEGNGICDCGDPEAFLRPLNCSCQGTDEEEDESLPEELSIALKGTMKVCLDYILDVTNFSVPMLPLVHDKINRGRITSEYLSNVSSLPPENYGGASDENTDSLWYLVLWNDERHGFPEVNAIVRSAIHVDESSADNIAKTVHLTGRCILKETSHYSGLLQCQRTVESVGLVATIMSARDYMRENIVRYMFNWLMDITERTGTPAFNEASKNHLAEILLEPKFRFSNQLSSKIICELIGCENQYDMTEEQSSAIFESGLLLNGEFLNAGKLYADGGDKPLTYGSKALDFLRVQEGYEPANSRLQYLLAFEVRLPSSTRKILPKLIIPQVISDPNTKAGFCDQLIPIYPQLLTTMAYSDREEDLNCLTEIATQLFTCPTSVLKIVREDLIGRILSPLVSLVERHPQWVYYNIIPTFVESANGFPRYYRSLIAAVGCGIHVLGFIVEKNIDALKLENFFSQSNLKMLLLFLTNFQNFWPIRRKYGDHVEREIMDFVIHIKFSIPVLNIVKQIANGETRKDTAVLGVKLILDYLGGREIFLKEPGVANFQVSREPVAFVNPITSLLSYVIQNGAFETFQDTISQIGKPFMCISDFSLRSIVLGSQIKVGFWIRNGLSVSRQASMYFDSIMNDSTYLRDFHLNQIAAIFDDPTATLINFLDRWELLPWFRNEVPYLKTVYEDRVNSISEKFIIFVYNMIADRSSFFNLSNDERLKYKAKKVISYSLCDGPKNYSKLKSNLDPEMSELPYFDDLLEECTTFQPPKGLLDTGMYRLKQEIFETLDPLSFYLDSSQFQMVSESLMKNILAKKQNKDSVVILTPQITKIENEFVNKHLARFTKTKAFAKLLYKYLQIALDTSDETFLPQLLHLIHAILIDDEYLYGETYLNEEFINIPIGDILLSIIQTNMSKPVTSKAKYLLNIFISRDDRVMESLVDSFGKTHVDVFLNNNTSRNRESESEKVKRFAEGKKNKALKKFAKQRERFMEKNEFKEGLSEENDQENTETSLRTCILCGEPESSQDVYGILVNLTKSSVFWKLPHDNLDYFALAHRNWNDQESPKQEGGYGKGINFERTEESSEKNSTEDYVAATCGHGIHYRCYKRSSNNLKFYPCPICRNLCNLFLPLFITPPSSENITGSSVIVGEPNLTRYNEIVKLSGSFKCRVLKEKLIHHDYRQADRRLYEPFLENFLSEIKLHDFFKGFDKESNFFKEMQNLSMLIANTISMSEIATRINGNSSFSNFVSSIPDSTKTLLKSLIQCRAIIYEKRSNPYLLGSDSKLESQINKFWDSDQFLGSLINEVVTLFFQTDESFNTIARMAYTKLFTISLYSYLSIYANNDAAFATLNQQHLAELGEDDIETMHTVLDNYRSYFDIPNRENKEFVNLVKTLLFGVERSLLPFLRQLVVFQDVLTCIPTDSGYESQPNIRRIEYNIPSQSYLDSTTALCYALDLPPLTELIKCLSSTHLYNFEWQIFDIVLNSKIPLFKDHGILKLDYPGVVKLIDLPTDYNSCIANYTDRTTGYYDHLVCLHCGKKIKAMRNAASLSCCSDNLICFYPRLNELKLTTLIGSTPISISIPAPYLTQHGEFKTPRGTGKGTLNHLRYMHLNNLWLTLNIFGFITRHVFGVRQQAQTLQPDILTFGTDDEEDLDEDDENIFHQDLNPFIL